MIFSSTFRKTGLIFSACLIFFGAALNASPALGHAFPDHSEPRVGSEAGPPPEVKIWFDGPLEPVFSAIKVFNAAGQPVDKGDARVDDKDNRLLRVSLPPLPPGEYRVFWGVAAWDGHHTEGQFKFKVR